MIALLPRCAVVHIAITHNFNELYITKMHVYKQYLLTIIGRGIIYSVYLSTHTHTRTHTHTHACVRTHYLGFPNTRTGDLWVSNGGFNLITHCMLIHHGTTIFVN